MQGSGRCPSFLQSYECSAGGLDTLQEKASTLQHLRSGFDCNLHGRKPIGKLKPLKIDFC